MPDFTAQTPIVIPLHRKGLLTPSIGRAVCEEHKDAGAKGGCYIFAVPRRRADGWMPIYVGMATSSVILEALSADKINKVNEYLMERPAKELRLFLITHPTNQRGRTNESAIAEVESFLIARAAAVSPHLVNKHGIKPQQWDIVGVTRDAKGRRSGRAQALRDLLGLGDSVAPGKLVPDPGSSSGE